MTNWIWMAAPLLPLACLIFGSRTQRDTGDLDVTMKLAVRRHLQRKYAVHHEGTKGTKNTGSVA